MFSIYKKEQSMKVVRTRHIVTLQTGITAATIIRAMAEVPAAAVIESIEEDDDGSTAIIFQEEKAQT